MNTLGRGAQGPDVEKLQKELNERGAGITVDGDFGPRTDIAVRAFQKSVGQTADGLVGPKTWAALGVSRPNPESFAIVKSVKYAELRVGYAQLWLKMQPALTAEKELKSIAAKLLMSIGVYETVEALTGVPASVIAVIHMRESSQNFKTHLHNGDPLTKKTFHVPAGRPLKGNPPFSWTVSAVDALTMERGPEIKDWCIERAAWFLEGYNGWGYRLYHATASPYLWAGSTVQMPGKYVADGKWNRTAYDTQLGCMPLLAMMWAAEPRLALKLASI